MDLNSSESYHASRDMDLTKPHEVLDFSTRQIVVPLDGLFQIVRDMDHASRDMDLTKPNTSAGIWIFKLLNQKSYVWPPYGLTDAIKMDFQSKWI